MRVLVTGGAGYVGSVTAQLLLSRGHQVRALDSLLHGGNGLLSLYSHDCFEFIRGDIRSEAVLREALNGVDAVVHLAAIVGDPACSRQPDLAREVNLEASLRFFESCRRQGVNRFLFASTCSNYGKMSDPSQCVTETSELKPVSLYAETKVAVEKALLSAQVEKPAVTLLRFATVFGVSPRMRFDLTVNEFTIELVTKRKIVVYGEQFWRPYIHVRDDARAVVLALESPLEKVTGQVFNVGDTGQNYQKGRLVELICEQVGGHLAVEHVHREEDPRDYRVSFEKIRQELGFKITRTVEDGIREVIGAVRQGVITDFANPIYKN